MKSLNLTEEQQKLLNNEIDIPNIVNENDLISEKDKLKIANEKLSKFGENTPEMISRLLSENESLKKDNTGNDLKLENAKHISTIETLKSKLTGLEATNKTLSNFKKETKILNDAKREAKKLGIDVKFMGDIEFLAKNLFDLSGEDAVTKEGVGITPGMNMSKWLEDETKGNRSYWLQEANGGNSVGGSVKGSLNKLDSIKEKYNELMKKEELTPPESVQALKLAKEMKEMETNK